MLFWGFYYLVRIKPSRMYPQLIRVRKDNLVVRQLNLIDSKLKWDLIIASVANERRELDSRFLEENLILMKEELGLIEVSYEVFQGDSDVFAEFDKSVKDQLDNEKMLLEQGIQLIESGGGSQLEEAKQMVVGMEDVADEYGELIQQLDQGLDLF